MQRPHAGRLLDAIGFCGERLVGFLFVAAAALKALDITPFAVQISYYGVVRDPALVKGIAIATVFVETILGVLLLLPSRLRALVYGAVFVLLFGFSGLILYAWMFHGLEDCGCFGKYIETSPTVSILKNALMMAILTVSWGRGAARGGLAAQHRSDPSATWRKRCAVGIPSLSVVALCAVYGTFSREATTTAVSGTVETEAQNSTSGPAHNTDMDETRPFARFRFQLDGQEWDLGKGEYFVALLSDSCDHCAEAVAKLNELPLFFPELPPIIGLCLGDEETLKQFREETEPEFPTVLIDPLVFFSLIADAPPRYTYISEGTEITHWDEVLPNDEVLLKQPSLRW